MENIFRKKTKIIVIVIVVLITAILAILEFSLIEDYNNDRSHYNDDIIKHYKEHYDVVIYDYRTMARMYYDEVINKENILDIIQEANGATDDRQNVLRKELYDILEETYFNAVKNNFRQVHFVLDDCTSFLRMHKIEKYGDDLREIRYSVRIVDDEKRYAEGFEEGRVNNGYRFEFPLFNDDEYIGCVETSIAFTAVTRRMDILFDHQGLFIIKKSVVDNNLWEEYIEENYIENIVLSDYYYDNEVFEYAKDKEIFINISEDPLATKEIKEKSSELLKQEKTFLINIESDNKDYFIVFLEIENIIGEHNGYLVFYGENKIVDELRNNIIIKTIFLAILWLVLIISVFVHYSSRIKINKYIFFDKLTGAYGQNKFDEFIKKELERSKRYGTNLSIVGFDIDRFKHVNDTYGHGIGDAVLKEAATLVINNIRVNDYLFRIGGDEFLVLLPNTGLEEAIVVAEKFRKTVEKTEFSVEKIKNITFSIGVVQYKPGESINEFVARADTMMYTAKRTGKNRVASE